METWDAVRSRRDVRSFDDRPVRVEQLDQILEAGRRSPSSSNWQPWDFIVVTERDVLADLAKVWRGAAHVASSAATVALVTPTPRNDEERERAAYDLGQATAHMMITAADMGIASGHSSVHDQRLARQILGFPENRFCAYLIPLGYPADRPLDPVRRPDRRPFDEVVHRGRW